MVWAGYWIHTNRDKRRQSNWNQMRRVELSVVWVGEGFEQAKAGALKLVDLPPAYIDTVINSMRSNDDSTEKMKELKEQKEALLRLKLVMESRLISESSVAKAFTIQTEELVFDASLDDDEALLLLMHGVDSNSNGAISEAELMASPQLTPQMREALTSAFACNLTTVEEALDHVDAEELGEYTKTTHSGGTIDKKASVKALFDALAPSDSVLVKKADLVSLATKLKTAGNTKLASALSVLASSLLAANAELDFLAVKREARRMPRVIGHRVDWARRLGLDTALAQQLPPGTLEDGLAGVRRMPLEEAQRAVEAFLEDARVKILAALLATKEATGSKSAAEANSKFIGFQGSFASLKDFHAGAEESLQLGYPNPDTMKGILNEHTVHPSAKRLFMTSNYRLVTCLLIEYAWAMFEESPEDPLVKDALDRAIKVIGELAKGRADSGLAALATTQRYFPGEVGDSFAESLVILTFPGVSVGLAEADKTLRDKAKEEAFKFLQTEEEKVRGVTILDHKTCTQRIRKDISLQEVDNSHVSADKSSLRVGLLLPMSLVRARAILDQLMAALKAVVADKATEVVADKVSECTWTFSRFTSVKDVRKWLKDQRRPDLLKLLGKEKEWAYVDTAKTWPHELLIEAMVSSFIRTELQAELRAALKSCSASDTQFKALLSVLELDAVEALDSEEKWSRVEAWVRLYRGRIQGRMRLGLKALLEREKEKIAHCNLTKSEVLAGHIYTGANFVPLNGICRSFPQSILDLLKGDEMTPDNKLCTTLFCISSCLKKLSQTTELPVSRCNHLVVMVEPKNS